MRKEAEEYIKTLRPITDFTKVKRGQKMFNRESISNDLTDIFVSYNPIYDIVTYINSRGETWSGISGDYWYYLD